MPSRTNEVSADKSTFAHAASQPLTPRAGFSPLSLSQFGSKTLAGDDLNKVDPSEITVGKLTGPLPHKSSTMGTEATITSWRKSGVLPHSTKTSQSTFGF